MVFILETNKQGNLQIPSDILPQLKPHMRYQVEVQGETLILRPQTDQSFWNAATPAQRVTRFRDWATKTQRPETPPLPDEALSRETIYD